MNFDYDDVLEYIEQEDVKFIRLAFCDIKGNLKNISIMPDEVKRAFTSGISFDASAIKGFETEEKSDLFLFPVPSTLMLLPWRPSQGRVVRMFCNIKYPDGTPFNSDCRYILENAVNFAKDKGFSIYFGTEFEFYLFKSDENGNPTNIPFDNAGYFDVAPEDKGENVRREICLTLLEMGMKPECSHHEEGPGQNEIDFKYSDAISAADNAINFITVVKAAALSNGLYADFSPKPIKDCSGNGLHVNMSIKSDDGKDYTNNFIAGIIAHIKEMTAFLNPTENSYKRLGEKKAPKYITWSKENRSQLIRIPAATGEYKRIELRSPDPLANPYITFALLIYAGLDGILNDLKLQDATDINLFTAEKSVTENLDKLPNNLSEAVKIAQNSDFVKKYLPEEIIKQLKV